MSLSSLKFWYLWNDVEFVRKTSVDISASWIQYSISWIYDFSFVISLFPFHQLTSLISRFRYNMYNSMNFLNSRFRSSLFTIASVALRPFWQTSAFFLSPFWRVIANSIRQCQVEIVISLFILSNCSAVKQQ